MSRHVLKIDVWSDIACPWCYVGKHRLDRALAQIRDKAVGKVEWHAYLLDPNFSEKGEEIDAYATRRFGPGFAKMKQRLIDNGTPDGAHFSNWRWRSNTLKGHMLIAIAREHGKSNEAAELLFEANYEKGGNLSEASVLIDIASKLGLQDEARSRLGERSGSLDPSATAASQLANGSKDAGVAEGGACSSSGVCAGAGGGAGTPGNAGGEGLDGELLKTVELDDAMAKYRLQVSGVPFFLISANDSSKRYALSGAQPVEVFLETFEEVLAEA